MASAEVPFLEDDSDSDSDSIYAADEPEHGDPLSRALEPPVASHLTLHEFRKFQNTPVSAASLDDDFKRVRRKASVANLALSPAAPFGAGPSFSATSLACLPRRQASTSDLPPTPTSPLTFLMPSTSAPSLSYTVDTPPSAQSFAYTSPASAHFLYVTESRAVLHTPEPLRTKRRFESVAFAKRLPLPGDDPNDPVDHRQWQVHAAIFDLADAAPSLEHCPDDLLSLSLPCVTDKDLFAHRQRSVRFVGVNSSSTQSSAQPHFDATREALGDSTFTLSKFTFPAPPTPQLATPLHPPTPPVSPTTIQFGDASFDIVNPHASLSLQDYQFETPAEINHLIDDYFDNVSQPPSPVPGMDTPPSAGSARPRALFTDLASAHRKITGSSVPSAIEQPPTDIQDGDDAMNTPSKKIFPPSEGQGTSHIDNRLSVLSEPFDLQVSDEEAELAHGNIDQVLGRDHSVEGGLADNLGANDSAFHDDPDTTYAGILQDYEYTREPVDNNETAAYEGKGKQAIRETDAPTRPLPQLSPSKRFELNVDTNLVEVPSSNQTYGSTDELLRLTPKRGNSLDNERPRGPLRVINRTPNSNETACMESASPDTSDTEDDTAEDDSEGKRKKNHASSGDDDLQDPYSRHFDQQDASFQDDRSSYHGDDDDRGLSRNPFAGFSGGRGDHESGWYTDHSDDDMPAAHVSIEKLSAPAEELEPQRRMSDDSYADTSVYSQEWDLPKTTTNRASMPFRNSVKVDQLLGSEKNEEKEDQKLNRAVSILKRVARNAQFPAELQEKPCTGEEMQWLTHMMHNDKERHARAVSMILGTKTNRLSRNSFDQVVEEACALAAAEEDSKKTKLKAVQAQRAHAESYATGSPGSGVRSHFFLRRPKVPSPIETYQKVIGSHRNAQAPHSNPAATGSRDLLINGQQSSPVADEEEAPERRSSSLVTYDRDAAERAGIEEIERNRPATPLNFANLIEAKHPSNLKDLLEARYPGVPAPVFSPDQDHELIELQNLNRPRLTAADMMQGPIQPIVDGIYRPRPTIRMDRPAHGASNGRASADLENRIISGPRNPPRRRNGPMTDEELMERESMWTMEPDFGPNGPLARAQTYAPRRPGENLTATKLRREHAQLDAKYKAQSRIYLILCAFTPVTCVLYGIGKFDGYIAKRSDMHVSQMCPLHKKKALFMALPICLVVYLAVIVTILSVYLGANGAPST